MAELGKTVRIVFQDGQERIFPNASIDTSTEGWLRVTRLQEGPMMSGVAEPIAGYRLEALRGWEYTEGGQQADTSMSGESGESRESGENGASGENGENGEGNGE